jgi:uncharacterized membrane protein
VKWNDWYLAAAFTGAIWAASMAAIIFLGIMIGMPLVVVSKVTLVLSVAFLMLALVFVAIGSGTVVVKDLRRRVRV